MSGFQKTLFTLAMFVLVTQTVRHVYVKWFEDRTSVLDGYTKDETDQEIDKAESLEELLAKYGPLKEKVDQLDKQCKGMPDEELKKFKEKHSEEYRIESQVGGAIRDWESKSKEIRELRIFWSCGVGLLVLGALLHCKGGKWLGMALIIPGFSEMIWWTSPSFALGGARLEFNRLLNNKIFFSAAALVLLVAVWLALGWTERTKKTLLTPPST